MEQPHGIERGYADRAPLDRDVQGLVVRISDDDPGGDNTGTCGGLLEKPAYRSCTVTDQKGLRKEPQRFFPEL